MNQKNLKLWDQNSAYAAIVLAENACEVEIFAAKELSSYLSRMSGQVFLISNRKIPGMVNIHIGLESCRIAGFTPDNDLTDDGFMMVCREDDIFITGTHERGTLFGVYEFLEEKLGCRFFSPAIETVPQRSEMEIPSFENKEVPKIEYRSANMYQFADPVYAAKRKINGRTTDPLGKPYRGRTDYGDQYFVHTLSRNLISPDEYFDEHPEYFAEINGKRIREKTQLCLTNPDVLKIVTEKVLEDIRKQPQAKIFSISQYDDYNGCTCPKCRALDEYEGSQAGSLLHFVNAVAEEVEKEFPDVIIDTLAYQYTRRPPKHVRARKNVCVRLCSIECCFLHPMSECTADDPDAPKNNFSMNFRDDTLGWSKQCDRLYVWDYVTNFSHFWMPHPNFHVLAENIRFLYENNARGFFEQGSGPKCVCGGEMNDLRAYIIGKAMWDPYCDAKKLQTEFLAAAYGASAGCMEEYLDTVYQAVLEAGCHLYCFNHPDKPWHTMKLVERCEDIFAEAKKLAADEEILDRIKLQELAVRYLRILLTPKGSAERNALLDTFAADAKAYGITQLSERLQIDENIAVLRGEADPGYWWAK